MKREKKFKVSSQSQLWEESEKLKNKLNDRHDRLLDFIF